MANSKIDDVLKRLDDIRKWKSNGATDEQIAAALGITRTSLYRYKKINCDICNALKKGTEDLVLELRGELARQAKLHTLKTTKTSMRVIGGQEVTFVEETETEHDGNLGAIHLLLKNYDPENWKENWDAYNFKKQEMKLKIKEFKLKKKLAEDW